MVKIKEIIDKLIGTFDVSDKGFSARKITAFAIVGMTLIIEWTWLISGSWEYLIEVLVVNVSFVGMLLGLTTVSGIITKNKKSDEKIVDDSVGN